MWKIGFPGSGNTSGFSRVLNFEKRGEAQRPEFSFSQESVHSLNRARPISKAPSNATFFSSAAKDPTGPIHPKSQRAPEIKHRQNKSRNTASLSGGYATGAAMVLRRSKILSGLDRLISRSA